MTTAPWDHLSVALAHAEARATTLSFWLRDDDATTVTPAFERLTSIIEKVKTPALIAAVPAGADEHLAHAINRSSLLSVAQHGFSHANHAGSGERAVELGGQRPADLIINDLVEGGAMLRKLFGPDATQILVPPWNRIDEALRSRLPDLGYAVLSTFGTREQEHPRLQLLPCTIDIIDWRNGRRCHPYDKLVQKLVAAIEQAIVAGRPIGLLTHHLAHDEEAWSFLARCLECLAASPAVEFKSARAICGLN